MTTNKKLLVWCSLLIFCLIGPASAQAQAPPSNVLVIYPAAEPQADSLALSVFFTIVDENGQPISRPGIETVSIQLLGGSTPPTPASFADPNTPFYIAIVLDASGSMKNVMDSVHKAAQEAIGSIPPAARVGVIKFNDLSIDAVIRPIQNFTTDMVLVNGAINAVQSDPGAPTCLYNAAYKTIELLDETTTQPQERQAIILFTDGKDERADGTPCSQWKYEDVINRATRAQPITPIHTIGLCADAACSNLKKDELRNMAKESSAFSATGSQENLSQLFQGIMEGLSAQLVAKANVYPAKGENQAVLSVKLRDRDAPLTTTFNFISDRDYNAPPPPVTAQIASLIYDGDKDVYTIGLSVSNPENLSKVVLEVWDEKGGTQVPPAQEFDEPQAAMQVERPGAGLNAGREYSFRVKAVDKKGFLLANEKGENVLAQSVFVYEPPPPPAIAFVIKSVQADFSNDQLRIDLDIPDAGQVNSFEGFIVDQETGAGVYDFSPTLFSGSQIVEKLPPAIKQAVESRDYRLTIFLNSKKGERLQAEPYSFKAVPPPPPGLLLRMWKAVQLPAVLLTIVVIIFSTVGVVIYWSRPARKENLPPPLPRPPIDHTMISVSPAKPGPEPVRQAPPMPAAPIQPPRLRLDVVESPNLAGPMRKVLTTFPYVIGRDGCDLNLGNDPHLSRRHAEITLRGRQFYVTDLGSRNGVFLGETRLPANTPTPVNGAVTIGLGRRTRLNLTPE